MLFSTTREADTLMVSRYKQRISKLGRGFRLLDHLYTPDCDAT